MRRLKTGRRPPIYPKTPGHLPCSSLTHPLPLSSRPPSVSFGGFGVKPLYSWGGEIHENPRSITYLDGDLFIYTGNQGCVQRIDPINGDNEGELCPGFNYEQSIHGARGLAASSDGTLFASRNDDITQSVVSDQQVFQVGRWTPTSLVDVEAMTFVGEVLYLADDNDDTVYKASKPSGITSYPQGLAYDGTELYILVDGGRRDHIVVVNPATGAVVRDFPAPHRNSVGITHMDTQTTSTLFVTAYGQDCCGRMHFVYRVSPIDGSELAAREQIFQEDWVDGWYGLTNDGESLILAPDRENFVILLDPDTLNFQKHIFFYNGFFNGFDAIAFHKTLGNMLATAANSVTQMDQDGRFLQEFGTTLSMLNGAVVIGNAIYLAEAQNNTIQASAIPAPPTQSSASPKGMASDGIKLYLVVDGSPRDRIQVLGTDGTLLDSFEAPGDNTNGLAWHNGQLYAVTNEFHPQFGDQPAHITVMSASGVVAQEFDIQAPWGGMLYEPINGLASDGTFLYAGSRDGAEWFVIDPANPNAPAVHVSAYGDFQWTDYVGSLEIAAAADIPTTLLSSGWSDSGQVITRIELDGLATEQFNIPLGSIEGMAYTGTDLYLADADVAVVYQTTLINNIPETTNVGNYSALLRVASDSTTSDSDPAVSFSIARNTDVRAQIMEPLEGFATTTSVIPVQGRINDPSIDTVTVGVRLPDTLLLEDHVDESDLGYSESLWDRDGLWHIDCGIFGSPGPIYTSPPCWWRFGEADQGGFGRGERNEGSLTSDIIEVGAGARLEFNTWYETEPVPEADLKLVEASEITYDDAGNPVEGPWRALVQIVGFGFGGAPVPPVDRATGLTLFEPHQSFFRREMEQAAIEFGDEGPRPRFERVHVSLRDFRGTEIKIRFRFDTVNEFANGGNGWFVDDVEVLGAGFKGQTTAVTPLDPPVVVDNVKWYGTFASTATLGEGENEVIAFGRQPYAPKPSGPNLVGVDRVFGFLDLTGPFMELFGIDPVVSGPLQTLDGFIDDINLRSMEIAQTFLTGVTTTDSKTIFAIAELPQDGEFSVPISLLEGLNTFTATGVDGSGNQSVYVFEVRLNTQGPTLTPLDTSYPVGFTSARAGDLVVIRVDATDNLGVDRIEMRFADEPGEEFARPGEIPQAVLSQWQASSGNWVFPIEIPPEAPPGVFEIQVVAIDFAGNETSGTVTAAVVATLEGFSFNLMPGYNLISLPLKPDDSYTGADGDNMVNLLGAELLAKIETISYYDASLTGLPPEDRWLIYSPDAPEASDTFNFETGKGYWTKMKDAVFEFDDPLAPGLPPTPRPVVWSYTGRFIDPGTLPPSYEMGLGWNLVGFHSENVLPVTTALQSLESPDRIWASLYQFNNLIEFEFGNEDEEGGAEIVLGAFERELPTGDMVPGKGYWLFMVEQGVLVP